jgi:[ribosomal protein S18]-alanine N-acetyltransferase
MADAGPATRLTVRPLQRGDAEAIASWRYDGPWSTYDARPDDPLLSAETGYLAVVDDAGSLVGFLCTGVEARVPGLAAQEGIVDIGVGMRPDLVGRGLGSAFGALVLGYIRDMCGDRPLRAVVQSWNERSLRLSQRLGFGVVGIHRCEQDGREVSYTMLVRPPEGQTANGS